MSRAHRSTNPSRSHHDDSPDRGLTRRDVLRGAATFAGSAALASLAPGCTPIRREGIYTDAFTVRIGDPLRIHAALVEPATVNIDLMRLDGPAVSRVFRETLWVGADQHWDIRNGVLRSYFETEVVVPTDDLVPGVYEARIPKQALLEENQRNLYHAFPSNNTKARLVVTNRDPGTHSRILWVHDSLTGAAYGGFGRKSIYGDPPVKVRTVTYARPGLDRGTNTWGPLALFRDEGYECEFIDLLELWRSPLDFLDAYDLVVLIGQFEYLPHDVLAQLHHFLEGGGNIFSASNEFGTFRVRLDEFSATLTTYKSDFEREDPMFGTGDADNDRDVAGVGMTGPRSFLETEILAQTVWAAHRVTRGATTDLPVYNLGEAGWILDGTGIGPGGALPAAFKNFGSGNLLAFDGSGQPQLVDQEFAHSDPGTVVWGAVPSTDARAWWLAEGRRLSDWPRFEGHATATLQQRSSGARVVALPTAQILKNHVDNPVYRQIFRNIMSRLVERSG